MLFVVVVVAAVTISPGGFACGELTIDKQRDSGERELAPHEKTKANPARLDLAQARDYSGAGALKASCGIEDDCQLAARSWRREVVG